MAEDAIADGVGLGLGHGRRDDSNAAIPPTTIALKSEVDRAHPDRRKTAPPLASIERN